MIIIVRRGGIGCRWLGWNRVTISKGIKELTSGMTCEETEEGAALLE